MGTAEGKAAFASQFGTKSAMAAAAPLASPEKLPEEEKPDDEMFEYDFEYNPTGATQESTGSSAERRYFTPTFSAPRKIRAKNYSYADGGATGIAGGMSGESADTMGYLMGAAPAGQAAPTASQAGLQYLMGQTSQSPVTQSALQSSAKMQAAREAGAPIERAQEELTSLSRKGYSKIKDGEFAGKYEKSNNAAYAYDPASQKFQRTDTIYTYTPTVMGVPLRRAEGGLISRPEKTTRNKKGLAS
jgi:hypothetical protein